MRDTPTHYRFWLYVLISIGSVIAALFSYQFFYRYPIWTLRAFRVPASSMCPAICNGERVFVQMRNGDSYVPHRGDVIAFNYNGEEATFLQRVRPPWQAPPVCAKSLVPAESNSNSGLYSGFNEKGVPAGEIFVIGDNLYNSNDSRVEGFAPITLDQVIGKPVMIYWSPESARIGCPIR
jgi:signal peptidase I